jgi:subtilisin family serine protease/subtilisin-like proprotein convertase family protein
MSNHKFWYLVSLIFLVAAIVFWMLGNRMKRAEGPVSSEPSAPEQSAAPASKPIRLLTQLDESQLQRRQPQSQSASQSHSQSQSHSMTNPAPEPDPRFPRRLTNTGRSIDELARSDSAVLLRNAFIDTAAGVPLRIPEHLRSPGEPGAYIVQSRGPAGPQFRENLQRNEAQIISYIPNDAYLVRVSAEGAERLRQFHGTQAVLPYEPYFKLSDEALLEVAVEQEPLPAETLLLVTAYSDSVEHVRELVFELGGEVVVEERSPFGPQLVVNPAADMLLALAQSSEVQGIERYHPRQLWNDRTRIRMGVAPDGVSPNHLDLTGKDVLVNVNDSGVDVTHPDLAGRVFPVDQYIGEDPVGHGTHVAGIIAGDGTRSSTVDPLPFGSEEGADFRGIAPEANILAMPIWHWPSTTAPLTDTYLQESAALTNLFIFGRTNSVLISNNSWGYVNATEYDSSAARFDAAVRDALPGMSGSHPILYVFAAGNAGWGADEGLFGDAGSISSPATAKNVITVGALENFRSITNMYFTDEEGNLIMPSDDLVVVTNQPFFGLTDTEEEAASFSSRGNVGIGTEGRFGRFKPDVIAPGTFVISASASQWNLEDQFHPDDPLFDIMEELNEPLQPSYRYESGTSMAAPAVAGFLALMQEFFEQRLPPNQRMTNSPALMKALLINGARSAGPLYNLQVENTINYQGWGLVNLSNTLPALLDAESRSAWPIWFVDQSPTNSLATGETKTWDLTISEEAEFIPLRFTLVWTDPPGNPSASLKLVNDLDLVVSNKVTGEIFYGNHFPADSDFTAALMGDDPPRTDIVNNVENVFIREPEGTEFSVSVVARRVNVNAVPEYHLLTGRTNDVAQDFALVISTGDATLVDALTVTSEEIAPTPEGMPGERPHILSMTNGAPLLNQRLGAHASLVTVEHGLTNQWRFFEFENTFDPDNEFNTMTNGRNVAFITFSPPNLSRPRALEADVDLYVSTNPGLTNLNPAVLAAADKGISRGGTEMVVYTNAVIGETYYLAIKAEDQQGAQFGLIALSTDDPFEETVDGRRLIHFQPTQAVIPDGTPTDPGVAMLFGVSTTPLIVQRAVVTNIITHENFGDLHVNLSKDREFVVLHNHSFGPGGLEEGTAVFIYDDSGMGDIAGSRPTDGPGSLNNFLGIEGSGPWMMTVIDNSPTQTGRVERATLALEPFQGGDLAAAGEAGLFGTIQPEQFIYYYVDVPVEATNMVIRLSQMSGSLEVYAALERLPTREDYDKQEIISPPGGDFTIGMDDDPPLDAGRYFIGLYNPGSEEVDFHIALIFEFGLMPDSSGLLISTNVVNLPDDARTNSVLTVLADRRVNNASVGVRIDHPRVSDLALRLISPQGTRILLAENRGELSPHGYGSGYSNDVAFAYFTEDPRLAATPIKFAPPPFANLDWTGTPIFASDFENVGLGIYTPGMVVDGWRVASNQVNVVTNELTESNIMALGEGAIARELSLTPNRQYTLRFAVRSETPAPAHALVRVSGNRPRTVSARPAWEMQAVNFVATNSQVNIEIIGGASGLLFDILELRESGNTFYLPEESLEILRGERAMGDWQLELWDTRAGPGNGIPAALLAWELQLELGASRPPAVWLTNAFPHTGVIANDQTNYFVVEVCESASIAVNLLSGPHDSLVLLANRSGFPTGTEKDDYVAFRNFVPFVQPPPELGFAFMVFTRDEPAPAPLEPGHRYFLAVHNRFPDETNEFRIQVFFDRDTCHDIERPIIELVHDVPYTNAIPPVGGWFDYYVYNVSACNPEEVIFELAPDNGDLGLVVRRGRPPLPDLDNFHYMSDEPGIVNEVISVTTNSVPEPLVPGDWYLGVFNNTTNLVSYTITATEISELTSSDRPTNVVTLVNAVPLSFTLEACPEEFTIFQFPVPPSAEGVEFELSNLSGNAELLVGHAEVPGVANFFRRTPGLPDEPATIVVTTNDVPVSLEGDWFLRVLNRTVSDLQFTIRAELFGTAPPPSTNCFIIPSISLIGGDLCFRWPSVPGLRYRLEGKVNIEDPVWQPLSPFAPATASESSFCLELPTEYRFFQVFEECEDGEPPVTEILNPRFEFNQDEVCLVWDGMAGSVYHLEGRISIADEGWTDLSGPITGLEGIMRHCLPLDSPYRFFQVVRRSGLIEPAIIPLTNNVHHANSIPAGTNLLQHYVFTVSSNATSVLFDLAPENGDLGLLVRKGLPLPDFESFDYASDEPGPANEFIMVTASSAPVALAPGEWYLTVYNNSTNAVDYLILAREQGQLPGGTDLYINPLIEFNDTEACFSWASVIGAVYHLQGKTSVVETGWVDLSGPITANSEVTSHCVPLIEPYRFFQVVQIGELQPVDPEVTLLMNLVPHTSSIGSASLMDFYQFDVSSNAVRVRFELAPQNGDLGLLLRKGTPLPTRDNFDYRSDMNGVIDEVITITTDSQPVALSPGEWYLGVFSHAPGQVDYTILATEEIGQTQEPPPPAGFITPGWEITADQLCLHWPALSGPGYYLEGRTNLISGTWERISDLITATGTNLSFCVDLPTPYSFFQVAIEDRQIGAPELFTLTNGIPFILGEDAPSGATNYFLLSVPAGKNNLYFQFNEASGPAEVFLGRDFPPGPDGNFRSGFITAALPVDWMVETNAELATLEGNWYLGLISNEAPGPAVTIRAGWEESRLEPRILTDGTIELTWPTTPGEVYLVQVTTSLLAPVEWITLATLTATGSSLQYVDPAPMNESPARFYRIQSAPAP